MSKRPYQHLPPLEHRPDGSPYRITPPQKRRASSLIRRECCCCEDGNCIVLDDGDTCTCPQTVSFSVCCKWFRWAVLPLDGTLEAEIFRDKDLKRCAVCGAAFVPKSNRGKYCPGCAGCMKKRKAANVGQRGKQAAFSLCRQALGRAHAPVRVYKCALCTKGIIRFSRPRCVFSDSPALPRSSGQAGERRRLLRRSWSLLLAQCSQRPHPGRSADGCASCVPLGITFAATPFPDFQAAGFSSSRPQSRLAIPRVFFSRFRHGWSLLSTCRHRKRTVDFLGCPFD